MLTVVCFIYYYSSSSQIFLWIGIITSFTAVFVSTTYAVRESYKVISVILFLFSLRMLPTLGVLFSGFTFSGDAADAVQLSYQIKEGGRFDFGMGTGRSVNYSYFPALYLFTVVLVDISGLSIEMVSYLLPLLTGGLTVTIFYATIRRFFSDKVAISAGMVYCICNTFIFFDANYIPEAFGLVFYAIFLMMFFFIYVKKQLSSKFASIGIIACFMIAISHHWSSYNIIFVLIFFYFFSIVFGYFISNLKKPYLSLKFSVIPLLTTICIVFAWGLFVGYEVIYSDFKMFSVFLRSLINPTIQHAIPTMHLNTPFERILIVAGYGVLMIVGISKFVASIIERDKARSKTFFQSWFIFASAYIFISYFGAPASFYYYSEILTRSWSFAFFGLSPIIAWGLVEIPFVKLERWKKLTRYMPLLLLLPLISTVLWAPLDVRNPSYFPKVESYRNTGIWIRHYLTKETVVIDSYTRETVGTYGRIKMAILPYITENVTSDKIIIYKSNSFNFVAPSGSIIVLNNQINKVKLWFVSTGKPLEMSNATIYLADMDLRCQRIYDCAALTILIGEF
jgi:hypothetical protein